jgi:hypothetical protein
MILRAAAFLERLPQPLTDRILKHIQKAVEFRGRLEDCRRLVDHSLNPTYRLSPKESRRLG